jgi:hypothetical protein
MVSGRIDGWVTFIGIFLGIALFTLTVDWVPGLHALYMAGSGEVSLLHQVLGVPALVLALVIVAGAVLAFVGAEKVEAIFSAKLGQVELTPPSRPRIKLAMGGSLAVLAVTILTAGSPSPDATPIPMTGIAPLALAEKIIGREPGMLILDLRANPEAEGGIPGSVVGGEPEAVTTLLAGSPAGTVVVAYDGTGSFTQAPAQWPKRLTYHFLEGGFAGWKADVLTPADLLSNSLAERERVLRQNQIAGFFSGAAVQNSSLAPPPPAMPAGGAGKKKKSGGC